MEILWSPVHETSDECYLCADVNYNKELLWLLAKPRVVCFRKSQDIPYNISLVRLLEEKGQARGIFPHQERPLRIVKPTIVAPAVICPSVHKQKRRGKCTFELKRRPVGVRHRLVANPDIRPLCNLLGIFGILPYKKRRSFYTASWWERTEVYNRAKLIYLREMANAHPDREGGDANYATLLNMTWSRMERLFKRYGIPE